MEVKSFDAQYNLFCNPQLTIYTLLHFEDLHFFSYFLLYATPSYSGTVGMKWHHTIKFLDKVYPL